MPVSRIHMNTTTTATAPRVRARHGLAALAASLALVGATADAAPSRACLEDQPCFNWALRGNVDRAGLIGWTRTERLTGDRTARKACR